MATWGPLAPRKENPGASRALSTVLQAGGQSSWGGAGAQGRGLSHHHPNTFWAMPALHQGLPTRSPRTHRRSTRRAPAPARRPPAQRTRPESSSWRRRKNLSLRGPSAQGMFPTPSTSAKGDSAHRDPAAPRTTHKSRIKCTPTSGPSTQGISGYTAFTLLASKHISRPKRAPYFVFLKHILSHSPSGAFGLSTLPEATKERT